ncbi:hypothetical protein [Methylovulum psychrotolerans]|uniref:Uncharacterized protein n=1 Tax=Methylovulum psychrotolerans TaxID=1704499 RepID=A0A2S5CQB5_9GAMM|nr:hypothetical protein [Methylovulum psychrotolerans]POZ52978.1 hypothetical protein AADEFJLK_01594 [Methylovulum psychrotolerans]
MNVENPNRQPGKTIPLYKPSHFDLLIMELDRLSALRKSGLQPSARHGGTSNISPALIKKIQEI